MKIYIFLIILFFSNILFSQFTDFQSPFTGRLNSGDEAADTFGAQFPSVAWICGDSGMVMKFRLNFGLPDFRIVKNGIPSTVNLNAFGAIDTMTALTAGLSGSNTFAYRTSNGGMNWVQVFTQNGGSINAIWFKTATTGFMAGNPVGGRWSLWKTINAGVTWDSAGLYLPAAGSESGYRNSFYAIGDSLWMGTNNSRIYYSSNYGTSWIVRNTGNIQNIYSIYFDESNVGFAGGDSLLRTSNFGANWNVEQNTPGSGNILGILGGNPGVDALSMPFFYSRNNVLYYGWGGWTVFHTAPSGTYTYLFKKRYMQPFWFTFSPMIGLLSDGKVWICNCAWGGVNNFTTGVPPEFRLYQNYPNPFNPVTKIKFGLPLKYNNSAVKLIVYDITGKEISILIDEQLAAGVYETEFSGINLPSGVYIYKLSYGVYSESKKMVIIK